MKNSLALGARLNRASLRERAMVFAAIVCVASAFWYQLLMTPLATRRAHIAAAVKERSELTGVGSADPQLEAFSTLKSRELFLTKSISQANAALDNAQSGLIEPKRMVVVLKAVLDRQHGLSLVRIRNLPVQSLLPAGYADKNISQDSAPLGPGPYLHPVEIELRGDYLAVLSYLRALESMPAGFQWQRFDLLSDDAGQRYRVVLATVSMEPNWLGV
jgi:MSHA biogenesis protein MshJ